MFRPTTLLAAGIIVLASASTLAAQQASPPKKAEPPHKPMASMPTTMHEAPMRTWTPAQVREAQVALAHLKLYDGSATGTMNTDTEEALRRFQREHSLAATGRLSDTVLVLLRKESATAPKPPTKQ